MPQQTLKRFLTILPLISELSLLWTWPTTKLIHSYWYTFNCFTTIIICNKLLLLLLLISYITLYYLLLIIWQTSVKLKELEKTWICCFGSFWTCWREIGKVPDSDWTPDSVSVVDDDLNSSQDWIFSQINWIGQPQTEGRRTLCLCKQMLVNKLWDACPFPREFNITVIWTVYIPPQGDAKLALASLANAINKQQARQSSTDSISTSPAQHEGKKKYLAWKRAYI